jgi:hypothetical protein
MNQTQRTLKRQTTQKRASAKMEMQQMVNLRQQQQQDHSVAQNRAA